VFGPQFEGQPEAAPAETNRLRQVQGPGRRTRKISRSTSVESSSGNTRSRCTRECTVGSKLLRAGGFEQQERRLPGLLERLQQRVLGLVAHAVGVESTRSTRARPSTA
jgi:hypothetical protein